MIDPRIYLASRSPRRRELLTQIGVRFDLLLFRADPREDAEVDETWHGDEAPEDYVVRLARAKAGFGLHLLDLDGEVIGKPRDEADAIAILTRLSGRSHRVLTAIAVAEGGRLEHRLSISDVRFRPLAADEIRRYVHSGEHNDKAGAYGIQGRAAIFIEEIRGSHSGIVGLPLCETALLLRQFGHPV